MMATFFTLPNYDDWGVFLYIAVNKYNADEILDRLELIGCPFRTLIEAEKSLIEGKVDTGLTYSNFKLRVTVMVIALTSSAAEFDNSLRHEEEHLQRHICQALNIDPYGEDAAYCAGEIAREIFPFVRPMLCDCCRKKLRIRNI